MEMTEILGWAATLLILVSFTVKDMFWLRVINAWGALVWLIYGAFKYDKPLIFVNLCVLVIHSIWFHRNKKKFRNV